VHPLILELLHERVNAMDPDPAERRLLIMRVIRLLYQADRLKHVCDVVQPADLGFQALGLLLSEVLQARAVVDVEGGGLLQVQAELFALGDLPRGLFEGNDATPGDEEADELLAEDPQGFVSLVLANLVIVLVDLPYQKAWLPWLHDSRLL
jgi:hypothetical protein